MFVRKKDRPARRGWRGAAILAGCVVVVAGAGYWIRSALLPKANAQNEVAAVQEPTPALASSDGDSDYSRRVVAYLYENEPITREHLGDYLIERYGKDKIDLLINKRIIDDVCRHYNVEVGAAEVDSAMAEELQGLAIDQKTFVGTLLARYHKNLYEWKEDVIRPKIQLSKLCLSRVHVSEEDVRQAYESLYGEKIECQLIVWPKSAKGEADALVDYARLRDNAEAFDQKAKAQPKAELAATAGKVRPFGRHVMGDVNFDNIVFRLQPNEVSQVIKTVDGPVVVKCLRRYPADTSVSYASVREKLVKQLADKKVVGEMQVVFDKLKKDAAAQVFLKKKTKADDPDGLPGDAGGVRSRQVVAVYNGRTPITREDLGEFLIARYGVEKIDALVNQRIIDKECQKHNLRVTAKEIEEGFADDLKKMGGIDVKTFEKDFLGPYKKNLYEWREDVVRPRLLLARMCWNRVKVTDAELKMAFDAHYGEKLACHMILWPAEQTKYALMEYAQVRDDPAAFAEKAKHQASSQLAAKGGEIPPFGRRTLGNEDIEREAFKLHPGEVTTLIGTPEGNVVLKLDKRIPPDTKVTLESKRAELTRDVFDRKVQMEMQTAFADLRKGANPKVMLKDQSRPSDLVGSTKKLLSDTHDGVKIEGRSAKR